MPTKTVNIIGCGGHSKVVLDALSLSNDRHQIVCWDENPALAGQKIASFIIKAPVDNPAELTGFCHIAIGNNTVREQLTDKVGSYTPLLTIIHPSASIASSAEVASGTFVAAKAILAPECYIEQGSIINHGAVVDHEVKIGAFSHIAPNSTLGGNVIIGRKVLIGSGATILPGLRIGDGATIGAGSVVVNNIEANTVVKGVPAR